MSEPTKEPRYQIICDDLVNVHSDDIPVDVDGDFHCEVQATIMFHASNLRDAQDFIHNLCFGLELEGEAVGAKLWITGEEDSVEIGLFEG